MPGPRPPRAERIVCPLPLSPPLLFPIPPPPWRPPLLKDVEGVTGRDAGGSAEGREAWLEVEAGGKREGPFEEVD